MSRLRCPLRTLGVILGNVADASALAGADSLVSMGWGMIFGAVYEVVGFAGKTSAMSEAPSSVSV